MRQRAKRLAGIAGAVAVLLAAAPAAAARYGYHDFRFDTDAVAGTPEEAALLAGARQQVDIVESVGLTPATLAFLHGFTIRLSAGPGGGHFGRDGVAINLPPRPDDRPILLHELMHAFQNGRLPGGMGNPAMRRFFDQARTSGSWPAGSYMLSNEAEFFAMTTSVELYGHAARPPFTRAALEEKQPEYAAWIKANVR